MAKFFKRLLVLFIILSLAGTAGISYYFSNLIMHPSQRNLSMAKDSIAKNWGISYDQISSVMGNPDPFEIQASQDQISLKGWYFQQSDTSECAAILAHGWSGNRIDMLKYAPIFWECGCDIIVYDHRAHNESGGEFGTAGIKEKIDLLDVTNWLQNETGFRDEQIAWVGESWGAATALQAGAMEKDIAFIVAESPYQDWESAIFERGIELYGGWVSYISPIVLWVVNQRTGVDYKEASPLNQASNIKEPVLLIHSRADEATASSQSVNISKKLNPATSKFYHLDWGAPHAQSVLERPEEFREIVHDFMYQYAPDFGGCGQDAPPPLRIKEIPSN